MSKDQDVDEDGEGLHRELRHREVWRAEADEHQGDAVAYGSERENSRHRRLSERCRNRAGDDDDHDDYIVCAYTGARQRRAKPRIRDKRRASDKVPT